MMVLPTDDIIRQNSKLRLGPLIRETPEIADKVNAARTNDTDANSTYNLKSFAGGYLKLASSNSPSQLCSLPAKNIVFDEVDRFALNCGKEGAPIELAEKRTSTFERSKKLFYISTPGEESASVISKMYDDGDQRKFFVPCPDCGHFQTLEFENLIYKEKKLDDVHLLCEKCNYKIINEDKTYMLSQGEWRATKTENSRDDYKSYHLNSLYSPVGWKSWTSIVKDFLAAKESQFKMQTFVNTILGETWLDSHEVPDWKKLYDLRENYKQNQIPDDVLFLTAGADIQKDRIEVEVVGWGKDKCSWSIDYRIFSGDTSNLKDKCWGELQDLISEVWNKNGVDMTISKIGIDSGYLTQNVYNFCRAFKSPTKVFPTKGVATASALVGKPVPVDINTKTGKSIRSSVRRYAIATGIAKVELYGWLRNTIARKDADEDLVLFSEGICHFPEYGEEFFKQLTSETQKIVYRKSIKFIEWEKLRTRNEALDCRVIARAAANLCGMDRFKDEHWERLEHQFPKNNTTSKNKKSKAKKNIVEKNQKKIESKPIAASKKIKRRKSTFL